MKWSEPSTCIGQTISQCVPNPSCAEPSMELRYNSPMFRNTRLARRVHSQLSLSVTIGHYALQAKCHCNIPTSTSLDYPGSVLWRHCLSHTSFPGINVWASSDVVNCLAILAKAPNFFSQMQIALATFFNVQQENKCSCILHASQSQRKY